MQDNWFNNAVIIARKEYFPLVYQRKNEVPGASFKLMEREEAIDHLSFSYKEDPLPYLVKDRRIPYKQAKEILRLLRIADFRKDSSLLNLYQGMKDRFFVEDDLCKKEFEKKKIFLLEAQEDKELHALFRRKGFSVEDIGLADFGIVPLRDEKTLPDEVPILYFQTRFEQFFYLFSRWRKKLIQHPEKRNRLRILIKDENEIYYLKTISRIFALPVAYQTKIPVLSEENIRKKIQEIYQSKSFVLSEEEKKDPSLFPLYKTILDYSLDSLPFSYAYQNLLDILSSLSTLSKGEDSGLRIMTDYSLDRNQEVYVLDFAYETFYQEFQNKSVFDDAFLSKVEANTSYQKTQLDERFKRNYLFFQPIVLLSRVIQHLNDHLYDSQFIEDFSWKDKVRKIRLSKEACYDGAFTKEARDLYLSYQYDRLFLENKDPEMEHYDPSFQGIQDYHDAPKTYSVSTVEKYANCPFSYYLSRLLPIPFDDYHYRWFGRTMHKMLEGIHHEDFSLEKALEIGRKEYEEQVVLQGQVFGEKEQVYLAVSLRWMEVILSALGKENEEMTHYPFFSDAERDFAFTLKSKNGKEYAFRGQIDKILTTTYGGDNYYTIVDYKTGKESFDARFCFFGKGIQLPFYYYAVRTGAGKDNSLLPSGDFRFGGFGIQHVFPSSLKAFFCTEKGGDCMTLENLESSLLCKGAILKNDVNYLLSLNREYQPPTGKTKTGKHLPTFFTAVNMEENKGEYALFGKTKDGPYCYPLSDLVSDSLAVALDTAEKIESGIFPIQPLTEDPSKADTNKTVCSFCSYRDICYIRKKDVKALQSEIRKHFRPYLMKGEKE